MLPYVVLIALPALVALCELRNNKGNDDVALSRARLPIIVFFVILFFLVSLRAPSVGTDTLSYIFYFETYSNMSWSELILESEPGYALLNKLISLVSSDPQFFLFIVGIIYILPIMFLYVRQNESPMLSIALFVFMPTFLMLFSGLRQALAIAIGIVAYKYACKKKPLVFVLLAVLALQFHRSAFMILFLYPLVNTRITKRHLCIIVPTFIVAMIFNTQIFGFFSMFVSDVYDTTMTVTNSYATLVLFILFSIISFIVPNENKLDNTTIGLRNILLFATAIQAFAPLHTLAMRMNYYFIIFIPLLLPKIINHSAEKWKKIATLASWVMTAFFIAYFLFVAPVTNALHTFPYSFFWE